ncbi:MAG: hypothetical protein ACRDT4_14610 [Micromonosporaceae bacterium]
MRKRTKIGISLTGIATTLIVAVGTMMAVGPASAGESSCYTNKFDVRRCVNAPYKSGGYLKGSAFIEDNGYYGYASVAVNGIRLQRYANGTWYDVAGSDRADHDGYHDSKDWAGTQIASCSPGYHRVKAKFYWYNGTNKESFWRSGPSTYVWSC